MDMSGSSSLHRRNRFPGQSHLAVALLLLFPVVPAALACPLAGQTPEPPPREETRLLRFPHIHGDRVLFSYAGDLYTAPLAGGEATPLTSHHGFELFGRFSPDGRWVAFSGEYSGTRQVHLVPAEGGEPRQLTFHPDVGEMAPRGGYDHLPLDWTPDGAHILFRAARTPWGERVGRYFLADPWNGGLETPLEIPEGASDATFDPTGTRVAYTVMSRAWREWKRHRGGRAQDVWIYDLEGSTSRRITHHPGTDHFPMWVGETIYFVSDREEGERLNLWAWDTATEAVRQVTFHDDFDVLWPARGVGGIVYENGGWIWHFDPASGETRRLSITVPGDRPGVTPRMVDARERIESFDLSPSGNRALFGARGEIFTAPREHGDVRNLSGTPGARERNVAWSPDGTRIAYLSDQEGDYDLYVRAADGSGTPDRVAGADGHWIEVLRWSPDSRRIALADNGHRLRVVEVEGGGVRTLEETRASGVTDFAWSPDSRWLAYTKANPNTMTSIWLVPADGSAEPRRLTGEGTSESSPAWDPLGRYLYFVSARDFQYGPNTFQQRIYLATLRPDLPHPFPLRSDEEPAAAPPAAAGGSAPAQEVGGGGGAEGGGGASPRPGPDAPVVIQPEGLEERTVAVPGLSPGDYSSLQGVEEGVLFWSQGALRRYALESRSAEEILAGISQWAVSAGGEHLLYRAAGGEFGIVPLRPGQRNDQGRLDLSGMTVRVDPREEWEGIYRDAWTIMRDWFYDPGLHGVDWEGMRDRYAPLVSHVAHRTDLDHVLKELIAELNAGHAYVNASPEAPSVERVAGGLLGAEFQAEGERYRISRIFPGENWHEDFRSPLTEPGVEVQEGDFLIAIDGEEVTTRDNPHALLEGKGGRIVRVTVNGRPSVEGARSYDVRPVTSELNLRYLAWIRRNAALVDSLSGGRIGYIHLPNTGVPGHRELFRGFQPQHRKEALILDDRYNGGGFIPEEMALVLGRPLLNHWSRRNLELYSQPFVVHTGPKAMLINGQSSSGGDAIAHYFRELGLGPLIGERSWGGLIGISGNPGFVDGGSISVPRFAFVDADGNWAVEGEGVAPDIEVVDLPHLIAAGREPMIERAVEELLRMLETGEVYRRPETPPGPDRSPGARR